MSPGTARPPGMPAYGAKTSENVVRHRKSASHSRSARQGSSREETAAAQPRRSGWWPGSLSACNAIPSSASGEGTTQTRSGDSPVMSMVTLMASIVHPPTDSARVD